MSYLFFDIDGTLLDSTYHAPVDSAVRAVHKAMENGHKCIFCTGRSYRMCDELSVFGIRNAIITNGSAVVADDEVIISHPIPKDIVEETIRLAESLDGGLQILDVDYGYQNEKTHKSFEKDFKLREPDHKVEDVFERRCMKKMTEYPGTPILKIDVVFDNEDQARTFREHMSDQLVYIQAGGYIKEEGSRSGELILKNYSKGTGIVEMLEYYHASLDDSYGFGDSMNDIGMLKTVRHPVVIAPGADEINDLAEYYADRPEDDGIEKALKHYHLI